MKITVKHIVYGVLLATALWMLPACNRKLDLPEMEGSKSIALLGELVADDSFCFRAGQSVPLASGNNLQFEVLRGLTIYATDGASNISFTGTDDSATATLYTIPFTSPQKVLPLHTYRIVASHPQITAATAIVEIPGPFTAELVDTQTMQYSTEHVMKVTLRIHDVGNTTNYYVIEALKQRAPITEDSFLYNGIWRSISANTDLYYQLLSQGIYPETKRDTAYENSYVRRILYTDDVNTDNVMEKGVYNRNRRVLLKDNTFNGGSHLSTVYVPVDTASFSLFEGGMVRLLVKSVPENYYRFLKAYENFTDAGGYSTFSQPVKVEGNVNNGVGMIGGAYVIAAKIKH